MQVSIIIPIFNVELYIADCIQSVMNQTFSGDIECILVDDCGQDRSIEIAEKLLADYNGSIHFSLIHHDHNKGLSGTRNTGIRAAKGEYLYFLDSDDTITPNCISLMWTMVEKYPGVECVFAGAYASTGYDWLDYTKKILPEYSNNRDWIQEGMLQRYKFSMTAWNRLISSQLINDNHLFFEEGCINEDELWNLALSQVITQVACIKKNLYHYIVRENSIVTSVKNNRLYIERRFALWKNFLRIAGGYHLERQTYMIYDYGERCVDMFDSMQQYFTWVYYSIKTIIKTPTGYRNRIIAKFHSSNMYIFKHYLHKCIHK